MPVWIADVFRSIMSFIDGIVYWFINLLIKLFDSIANVQVFSSESVEMLATRIYFLIAIVMIFKVSFSIIQYIINPDTISDKEKGMGQVIKNVIFVLVCLVGIKYVFTFAYKLQDTVVKTHIIEKLILGVDSKNVVSDKNQEDVKSHLAFNLLNNFVVPNTSELGNIFKYENGMYTCNGTGMYKTEKTELADGSTTYMFTNYNEAFGNCIEGIASDKTSKHISDGVKDIYVKTGQQYNMAQDERNYNLLLKLINDKATNNETYIFEYRFFASTAAGIFVAIMYLNFCIDVAIRSVKFGFLQLIAPIPIISMVDPKSSKGGMMSKWIKECSSTYAGLFIRIAAVNFVVFAVHIIYSSPLLSNSTIGGFERIVILFGALMFAKELPKLITDLTGIDLSGNFSLNPFKRVPGLTTAAGAVAAGAVGGLAGAVSAGVTHGQLGHKWWQTAGGLIRGLGQGAATGLGSGIKNHGQHFWQNGLSSAQAQANRVRTNDGIGFQQRISDTVARNLGIRTDDNSYRRDEIMFNEGKELYDKYYDPSIADPVNRINYDDLYKNVEFRNAVRDANSNKYKMIDAQNALDIARNEAAANPSDVTKQRALQDATKNFNNAKDAYDKMKERIETLGKKNVRDYNRYKAFKQYKDYYDAETLARTP